MRDEISLVEAAQELGLSYSVAQRLVLQGALVGRKWNGRWYVSTASIAAYKKKRSAAVPAR